MALLHREERPWHWAEERYLALCFGAMITCEALTCPKQPQVIRIGSCAAFHHSRPTEGQLWDPKCVWSFLEAEFSPQLSSTPGTSPAPHKLEVMRDSWLLSPCSVGCNASPPHIMEVLISKGVKEWTANGKTHFQSAGVSGEGEQSWIQGKAKRRMAGTGKCSLPYSYAAPLHTQIKWSLFSSLLLSSHTLCWLILSSSRSEIR